MARRLGERQLLRKQREEPQQKRPTAVSLATRTATRETAMIKAPHCTAAVKVTERSAATERETVSTRATCEARVPAAASGGRTRVTAWAGTPKTPDRATTGGGKTAPRRVDGTRRDDRGLRRPTMGRWLPRGDRWRDNCRSARNCVDGGRGSGGRPHKDFLVGQFAPSASKW